jgi:hypothetical protein
VFKLGSVYQCQLSREASLIFDGKQFVGKVSDAGGGLQIIILETELEMTLNAPDGEIYVEHDIITSRTGDEGSSASSASLGSRAFALLYVAATPRRPECDFG